MNTKRIRADAAEIGDRLIDWLERARSQSAERLPELQAEAEELWDQLGGWASKLPASLATRLPWFQPRRRRMRTVLAVTTGIALGAGLMYLFDREAGAERRARLVGRLRRRPGSAADTTEQDGHKSPRNASLSTPGYTS